MNTLVPIHSNIKALAVGILCSGSLLGCYIYPQSQPQLTNTAQLHPQQQESYTVSGHYGQRISKSDGSSMMVHVAKVGLLNPAKQITFTVSTTALKNNAQPACDYRGTATLMGQDALHGVVYTALLSDLALNKYTDADKTVEKNADEGLIFLRFKNNTLSIDSNNPKVLSQLCTGGLSLKGDYATLK